VDERLTGQLWVTVIATGLGQRGRRPATSGTPSASPSTGAPSEPDELEPPSFLR
jgi:hypothetical protein